MVSVDVKHHVYLFTYTDQRPLLVKFSFMICLLFADRNGVCVCARARARVCVCVVLLFGWGGGGGYCRYIYFYCKLWNL